MCVKHNAVLHGALRRGELPPFSSAFLRKFLAYAKRRARCACWRKEGVSLLAILVRLIMASRAQSCRRLVCLSAWVPGLHQALRQLNAGEREDWPASSLPRCLVVLHLTVAAQRESRLLASEALGSSPCAAFYAQTCMHASAAALS